MSEDGKVLTGGCSSVFSPCSGLALRFAKTPSLEEGRAPPPYTRIGASVEVGGGSSVTALCRVGESPVSSLPDSEGLPCISRWRSSPPSLSLSEPLPSSNVSASVRSASERIGSSEARRCRDVGEEARDRNEGGGELGTV